MIIGKGAGVILIDDNEKILLQQRDENNRWNRSFWSEFGGQIEEGETPEKAVKRELKEELGIELVSLKFFKKYNLQRKKGTYEAFFFTALLNVSIDDLKHQQTEGRDLALFTFQETKKIKVADYTKRALEDFFRSQ